MKEEHLITRASGHCNRLRVQPWTEREILRLRGKKKCSCGQTYRGSPRRQGLTYKIICSCRSICRTNETFLLRPNCRAIFLLSRTFSPSALPATLISALADCGLLCGLLCWRSGGTTEEKSGLEGNRRRESRRRAWSLPSLLPDRVVSKLRWPELVSHHHLARLYTRSMLHHEIYIL